MHIGIYIIESESSINWPRATTVSMIQISVIRTRTITVA